MTPIDIQAAADKLRIELQNIPDISMGNYRMELAEYRRMVNDILVLIRELAKDAQASPTAHLPLD